METTMKNIKQIIRIDGAFIALLKDGSLRRVWLDKKNGTLILSELYVCDDLDSVAA